jgi:hypothetical protein
VIYFLHSVGTAINPNTLVTFPVNADGTVYAHEFVSVHLADLSDEWLDGLSEADARTVQAIQGGPSKV